MSQVEEPCVAAYPGEWSALMALIAERGEWMHVMSRSWNSTTLCRCVRLLDEFVLTENGTLDRLSDCLPDVAESES